MQAGEQQKVLITPSQEPCVILSTNVAETSLTIPGVVAVIDSGLARRAAYDSERERNTLFVARITLQNAAQRAGRAGRLTKGVCVRLWGKDEERGMAAVIEPEVLKLDLASTVLSLCACYGQVRQSGILPEFLTPPPVIRWEKACQELARCGALSRTNDVQTSPNMLYPLTSFGVSMSKLPAEPVVAAILLESRSREEREINIAMAALWESSEASFAESKDLFDLAESFIADSRQKDFAREIHETVRQFERLLHGTLPAEADSDLRELVTRLWMRLFSHRIAAKGEGSVYTFQNRSVARLVRKKETVSYDNEFPGLIVALVVHERGGRSQTVKATIPLYLPLEESLVAEAFSGEISTNVTCRFDDSRRRPILEKSTRFRGLVFGSRELEKSDKYQELITACLVSKLKENIWDWKSDEPAAEQFLYRLKLAAAAFPGMGIPAMSDDDWELVYHELCENKKTLEEIQKGSMLRAIKSYIGQELVRFIEKNAPEIIMLPNGRRAKIIYSEAAPPEISARLGDFIGYKERFLVMQGRVQGVFDILAPNYRTVQKTADLGSFWKNTYPSIKQELQRKYPRHPWP
jgi:ATP-dependent helicase HrpB